MWPALNQEFDYTGLASDYMAGYPGTDGACSNYFSFNCYSGKPDTANDLERLRKLDYGMGKPSTGKYDIEQGGWHTFGGQG